MTNEHPLGGAWGRFSERRDGEEISFLYIYATVDTNFLTEDEVDAQYKKLISKELVSVLRTEADRLEALGG